MGMTCKSARQRVDRLNKKQQQRILISMMEKLSNAIKNIATNEGETK